MQNLIEIQIQEIGRMPHHNHIIHTTDKKIYILLKKSKGKKDTYAQRNKNEGQSRFFISHNTS